LTNKNATCGSRFCAKVKCFVSVHNVKTAYIVSEGRDVCIIDLSNMSSLIFRFISRLINLQKQILIAFLYVKLMQ